MVSIEHLGLILLEITVDFVLSVVPVFIEGGLCVLVAADEIIVLFFVPLVHFIESSIFMFFLKCLNFESALLGIVVLSICLVYLHYFVLVVQILLYFLQGPLHPNKIMISNNFHDFNKM